MPSAWLLALALTAGVVAGPAATPAAEPMCRNGFVLVQDKTLLRFDENAHGYAKLGELEIAVIPGEIYPELMLGKVQDPADPGADFPEAAVEPSIYPQMKGKHRMVIGLGNDEIGYIIPKRQWDVKEPHCYGLKKAQYGEMNSVGPDAAAVICGVFKELAAAK